VCTHPNLKVIDAAIRVHEVEVKYPPGARPVPAEQVRREAEDARLSWRSIQRAADDLGIVKRKLGRPGQEHQQWTWELSPEDGHEAPKVATLEGWHFSGELAPFANDQPGGESV
jgi:hypothetical protein